MKNKVLSIFLFLFATTTVAFAGEKTEKFEVKGNCGMCEKTIEKAALSVEGVSSADWNKESKQMLVTFDDAVASVGAIQKTIAGKGYETGKYKAKDEVYNKLHACCQYDRSEKKADTPK